MFACMDSHQLGYTQELEKYRIRHGYEEFDVGRVILEHKERYIVLNKKGEFDPEILGLLRYNAENRSDFPAVGDWVVFQEFNEEQAIIHAIRPRKNRLERKSVGSESDRQLIATNIDRAFIVIAAYRDFNINRIQRYLAIALESKIEAVVVLNKIDLITPEECKVLLQEIQDRIPDIPVVMASCENESGLEEIKRLLKPGRTYCLLGSSGVGKSTLLNMLLGEEFMSTSSIGQASARGKYTTTHRELILLKNGAMIIDNPGMREVGMVSASTGIQEVFDALSNLALHCKYGDCHHIAEDGCALLEALKKERLPKQIMIIIYNCRKSNNTFSLPNWSARKNGNHLAST